MPAADLNIALIGFGTVGTGVAQILTHQAEHLTCQAGRQLNLRQIVVRNPTRYRERVPDGVRLSDSIDSVLDDDEIDLVVQLIGGTEPALDYVRRFLAAGKDIVTANKALICQHGDELFRTASKAGRTICFEAAIAGGIPVIGTLTTALTANRIEAIEGILNGTSNFILTHILNDQISYSAALQQAQQLGYAEADPTLDVDGTDAAQKLAILTQLAFSTTVSTDEIVRHGIENLELRDLQAAFSMGYKVKLLAVSRLHEGRLELSVQPTLISRSRTLSQIDGADNIVAITGDAAGRLRLAGAGAGQLPTASAVIADIVDIATGRAALTFQALMRSKNRTPVTVLPPDELCRRYYIRCTVDDRPHVLADFTDILGRHQISISSLHQDETCESDPKSRTACLVIMTHRTTEGRLRAAEADLAQLDCVRGSWLRMPVAE